MIDDNDVGPLAGWHWEQQGDREHTADGTSPLEGFGI